MIRATPRWRAFEISDEAAIYHRMPFAEALARFEALWRLARAIDPRAGEDWRDDLDAARAIARAVNGLPPG